jgi:hypothetical protein
MHYFTGCFAKQTHKIAFNQEYPCLSIRLHKSWHKDMARLYDTLREYFADRREDELMRVVKHMRHENPTLIFQPERAYTKRNLAVEDGLADPMPGVFFVPVHSYEETATVDASRVRIYFSDIQITDDVEDDVEMYTMSFFVFDTV